MGKCWHKESGVAVKPGQIIEIVNHCVQLYCQKNLVFAGVGWVRRVYQLYLDGFISIPF